MSDDNEISPHFLNVVSQLCHFAWGALAITWVGLLSSRWTFWAWAALEVAAAVKEFWWDRNYENEATRGSDALDFLVYTAGMAAALLALRLHGTI